MRMKRCPWIFPAITLLLITNLLVGNQIVIGGILLIFWMLRIILLKEKCIFWQTTVISLLFVMILCFHQQRNKTILTGEEETFLLSPELSSIKVDGDQLLFNGKIEQTKEKVVVRYYFQTEQEKEKWMTSEIPSHLLITGELIEPERNSNFNQFNYQDYLQRNKIYWRLHAEEIRFVNGVKLKKSFLYRIDRIRYRIIFFMDQTFHEKVSSYLKILFIADRSALTEQTKESYRALGLIHLFSISGFHITYLTEFLRKIFLRIGITHERTNLLLVIILPFYGLVAGLSISVFRAVCQRTILLWSTILEKELDSLDAWSLAMIASLIINPYHLFELSFQLSYSLSGLFILMGQQDWIKELNDLKQTILFFILSFFISLPLLSHHFYEIPWITVITNLLFIPFFTWFLFPSLLLLFLMGLFLSNTHSFIFLNETLAYILIKVESLLSYLTDHFDFTFVIGRLPQILLVVLFICTIHLLKRIEQRKMPSVLIVLCTILTIRWHQISPVGYVLMLDVGQGDSILIKEPLTRKITMIDTGGEIQWLEKEKWQEREKTFTIGRNVVVPSLKSLGISSIDRLYITHAHQDHMGEIENIYKELEIKEIATTSCTFQEEELIKQLTHLKETRMLKVRPSMKLDYPTLNTLALHPIKEYQSKNDQSLVLYVKIGEDTWLFTGDMEEEAERDLIQEYSRLPVDYLKVGHHGSNTSSTEEFIDHINPETAMISVGQKNKYGHPNTEVLELLEKRTINTYSTAENGAIRVNYFKVPLLNKWFVKQETVK